MEERDYTKDIAILVAGTGESTKENTEALLDNFVFGTMDSVEATLIFPVLTNTGKDLQHVWDIAKLWGFKLVIAQNENAGHKIMSTWDKNPNVTLTRHASDRDALDTAFSFLEDHNAVGDDTAFIMAFNPDSKYVKDDPALSDEEILGQVKHLPWLKTLNLSDGLLDSFPGFETDEEKSKREKLEAEFNAKQLAEAPDTKVEEKPSEPRKRAPRKTVIQKDVPVLTDPETGVQSPSSRIHEDGCTLRKNHAGDCNVDLPVGSVVEVAGIPFVKKGPNPFRAALPTGELSPVLSNHDKARLSEDAVAMHEEMHLSKELSATVNLTGLSGSTPSLDDLLGSDGVEHDVSEYKYSMNMVKNHDSVSVAREDVILLGKSMESMAQGFTDAISVLTRILESN